MTQQARWMLWSAIVALSFTTISQAAETADEALSENPTVGSDSHDSADLIEEIVVVGNKKKRQSHSVRILSNPPEVERPSQIEFKFLPAYDPAEANREFSLVQTDERLGREGIVTLFRFSFGG